MVCGVSGNSKMEPGASVCRLAPCFVRFGSFQLPSSRGESQVHLVKKLADWLIKYHFPHLEGDFCTLRTCGELKPSKIVKTIFMNSGLHL